MSNFSYLDLLTRGGFAIAILIICSILSVKVVIEKFIVFRGISEKTNKLLTDQVFSLLRSNDLKEAIILCRTFSVKFLFISVKAPLANVYATMINKINETKDELEKNAYIKLDKEIAKIEKGLGVLATLGSISPFIGLFGTVIGIIGSFNALSISDAANYAQVMSGIADALFATAAGLLVAVPAVLFYNYFTKRLRLSAPMFDEAIQEMLSALKK